MTGTIFYSRWRNMKTRCYNPNFDNYSYYGGKGVKISEKWLTFENFYTDMHRSYLEHVKKYGEKNTRLDRIDNNGDYSKDNCRWVTHAENMKNRSNNRFITFRGETKCLEDWKRQFGFKKYTLEGRLASGWPIERAFLTPTRTRT